MTIEIDLTQLTLEQLEELSQLVNDSIDYSIETEEMQMNYEASQNIEHFISEL
jgi:hypothetical protein